MRRKSVDADNSIIILALSSGFMLGLLFSGLMALTEGWAYEIINNLWLRGRRSSRKLTRRLL
jgi:hypothetical protein